MLGILRYFQNNKSDLEKLQSKISTEVKYNCIKSVDHGASKLVTWALSLTGGSLLIVLNGDYLRPPENDKLRIPYLIFLLAWSFSGLTIYYGNKITRRAMAAEM
jgi:hypothetical protein